jgi:hypothetical protein
MIKYIIFAALLTVNSMALAHVVSPPKKYDCTYRQVFEDRYEECVWRVGGHTEIHITKDFYSDENITKRAESSRNTSIFLITTMIVFASVMVF